MLFDQVEEPYIPDRIEIRKMVGEQYSFHSELKQYIADLSMPNQNQAVIVRGFHRGGLVFDCGTHLGTHQSFYYRRVFRDSLHHLGYQSLDPDENVVAFRQTWLEPKTVQWEAALWDPHIRYILGKEKRTTYGKEKNPSGLYFSRTDSQSLRECLYHNLPGMVLPGMPKARGPKLLPFSWIRSHSMNGVSAVPSRELFKTFRKTPFPGVSGIFDDGPDKWKGKPLRCFVADVAREEILRFRDLWKEIHRKEAGYWNHKGYHYVVGSPGCDRLRIVDAESPYSNVKLADIPLEIPVPFLNSGSGFHQKVRVTIGTFDAMLDRLACIAKGSDDPSWTLYIPDSATNLMAKVEYAWCQQDRVLGIHQTEHASAF